MITGLLLASALMLGGVVHTEDGKGKKGIAVSNGDTIVMTDKKGRFSLPVIEDMSVFPILDGGWAVAGESRLGNAAFAFIDPENPDKSDVDFTIVKRKGNDRFSVNVIGDVQVGDVQELDYAARSLFPELMEDSVAAFNLWLGDLVNNNLSLYPRLRSMMEMLPVRSWTMVGNHDRDVDSVRTRQTASFSRVFGAPVYAFTEGNVTFIVLNNVYGDGARSYKGRLDDRQLRFVDNLMKILPADRRVVITAHIPLAHTSNRDELMSKLRGRGDVLALTGHMHAVSRYFHKGDDVTVHELVGGAACGFWWVGEKDWDGIPSALMQCGTPKGYFKFDFTPSGYEFRYKASSQDPSRQASIWISGIDTIQAHVPEFKDAQRGDMFITVYGGCDSTTVVATLDGVERFDAVKEKAMDPNVARVREFNLEKIYPTRHSRRNPFRRMTSPQVWRVTLPEKYRDGTHRVDVEASDSYGLRCRTSRMFSYSDR